jgi:hypothetical protein
VLDNLLRFCVRQWQTESGCIPPEPPIDFAVAISYGCHSKEKLTVATEWNARLAGSLVKQYAEEKGLVDMPPVFVSNCTYLYPGAEYDEWLLRQSIFAQKGVTVQRAMDMQNSVQEVDAIRQHVQSLGLTPKHILVVTGQMHSRFVRWIYTKRFPGALVSIRCIPYWFEYQPDHPVLMQRGGWRWLLANIERHIAYFFLGDRIARVHHRIATAK